MREREQPGDQQDGLDLWGVLYSTFPSLDAPDAFLILGSNDDAHTGIPGQALPTCEAGAETKVKIGPSRLPSFPAKLVNSMNISEAIAMVPYKNTFSVSVSLSFGPSSI